MKVLIVEDDPNKLRQLGDFVRERWPDANVAEARSYGSGLRMALGESGDILILDMAMPTFDVGDNEKGGRYRSFAGREILSELARKRASWRVVVVTQFETFGEGTEHRTRDELRAELVAEFPEMFVGMAYYNPAESGWRDEVAALLAPELGA